jgi:hypothetical protein
MKALMRQNLHTVNMFLSISAKYRVYCMKMTRIIQQCANCFEKESCVNTVAGLVNRFETYYKIDAEHLLVENST